MPELGIGTAAQAHLAFAMPNLGYASDVNGCVYHSGDVILRKAAHRRRVHPPTRRPGPRRHPRRGRTRRIPLRPLMRFRPCIDLHEGRVKQIVGTSLRDGIAPQTHFIAPPHPPAYFAARYCCDQLFGGHVIMLGPGNEDAATQALAAFPRRPTGRRRHPPRQRSGLAQPRCRAGDRHFLCL